MAWASRQAFGDNCYISLACRIHSKMWIGISVRFFYRYLPVHLFIRTLQQLVMNGMYQVTWTPLFRGLNSVFHCMMLSITGEYDAWHSVRNWWDNQEIRQNPLLWRQVSNKKVDRLAWHDVHEASHSQWTLAFCENWMGLNRHEPRTTATT